MPSDFSPVETEKAIPTAFMFSGKSFLSTFSTSKALKMLFPFSEISVDVPTNEQTTFLSA